jgi:methenyltetrahydrofolate cyclohydrolase
MENLSLNDFTLLVASNEPAPGGGSVSALSGAQAAALLAMYCRLSLGRKGLEDVQELVTETAGKADRLMQNLLTDISEDTAAFNMVVAAFKLPKSSDDEKEVRRAAIQDAFAQAARVPLGVAEQCLQLQELVAGVIGKGNNSAITDIGVAGLQAWAGLQGALYNVEINLVSLKDPALTRDFRGRVEQIRENGARLAGEIARTAETLLKEA